MPSCPQCGAQVTDADRFCGDCGIALSASGAGEARASDLLDAGAQPNAAGDPASSATPADGVDDAASPDSSPDSAALEADEPPRAAPVSVASSGDGAGAAVARAVESAGLAGSASLAGDEGAADESAGASPSQNISTGDVAPPASLNVEPSASESSARAAGGGGAGAASTDGVGGRGADTSGEYAKPRAPAETVRGGSTGGGRRSMSKPLDAGTLLYSRYEIVRRIGGGGMGAVYLAKDKNLGDQPRAVKEMIQQNIDESQHEKAVNDFRRESMLLSSLEHQSIPTIYDYFYDDAAARFYLVMKYISGGDFLARLRNAPGGRLDEKTVTDWGCQIADVLHYLHKQSPPIIYRDLKPANLMIDGNSGRVMLIDFGIARWVQKEEKGVTAVGTMGYAPPELFSGKVEPRSDIYSLGATMFHLLTGADPQDNPLLIFDFNKNPRPRQIAPSISNEMEQILMRAVEYKPEGRFRSAAEMRDVLSDHLEHLRAGRVTYGMAHANMSANLKTMQVEMVYCGFCGGRIAADDVYCAHCGQRQPMAVSSAALRQARATAKLVVAGTTELDSSFMLQKESSLVGRSDPSSNIFPEVDLSRFDPQTKISRRHARIFRKGDTYLVEDLGSVNGTVVNDTLRLAPHQPRALESGDKLRLGETTLHFLIG
ncbi:MAG: protein kinase [Acidobacteria bacterium]|nr:protein kinase [Acidobacteriota bacterium]